MSQRVIGIDPGLRLSGYGAVVVGERAMEPKLLEAGVIRLDGKLPIEQRLDQLAGDLEQLLLELTPDVMVVEKLYAHYRHPRTAILMAHARGVILLCAQRCHVPVAHMPSTEIKKALTGYGHASKQQMQHAVASQLNLAEPPSPPDVADALAIAVTYARRVAFERLADQGNPA